ncbi:MAG: RlmE family RNA methyltransferase [Holosporales bacterium]|nr:RlmE family RNA methyltransferase [Holosporales bacterium]
MGVLRVSEHLPPCVIINTVVQVLSSVVPEKVHNKRLKQSSRNWVQRQINDPYVAMAKASGYRTRAAFKLVEIQKKFGVLKKSSIVVDLGAAPGSWSQVASTLCKQVIAVDLLDIKPLPGVHFIRGDFLEEATVRLVVDALDGERVDVVLSDMAPNSCGIKKVDHIRITSLVEAVYEFCDEMLRPGGAMIAKVFQGGASPDILCNLKRRFQTVTHFKPTASRKESPELYLISTGFRSPH